MSHEVLSPSARVARAAFPPEGRDGARVERANLQSAIKRLSGDNSRARELVGRLQALTSGLGGMECGAPTPDRAPAPAGALGGVYEELHDLERTLDLLDLTIAELGTCLMGAG